MKKFMLPPQTRHSSQQDQEKIACRRSIECFEVYTKKKKLIQPVQVEYKATTSGLRTRGRESKLRSFKRTTSRHKKTAAKLGLASNHEIQIEVSYFCLNVAILSSARATNFT